MKSAESDLCYQFCLKKLNRKAYTVYEMKHILNTEGFSDHSIQFAIDKCKHYNFLNDQNYMEAFIHDKQEFRLWGKLKIFKELSQKGIEAIDVDYNESLERKNAQKLMHHKLEQLNRKKTGKDREIALYRFLYYRGFEAELIRSLVSKSNNSIDF